MSTKLTDAFGNAYDALGRLEKLLAAEMVEKEAPRYHDALCAVSDLYDNLIRVQRKLNKDEKEQVND